MIPERLAFVDIETTGTSFNSDRIIEVAILRVENHKLVHSFETLVNPDTHVSPYIQSFTGINPYQLENAPRFATISVDIEEILRDCVFVAHNVRFDYSFIQSGFTRLDKKFSMQKFCTVKLSKTLFPRFKRHDLDSLIERFNIQIENRHRAMGDAKAIWQFYDIVKSNVDEKKLVLALKQTLKRPTVQTDINLDNLPESVGVYIFRNSNNIPIYIGKSVNIKDRVLSHFSQNTLSSDFQICQQTKYIETIQTSNELEALIKESNLVKKLNPVYNRQLRHKQIFNVLFKTITPHGYDTVQIMDVKKLTHEDMPRVLGIFKNKKQTVNFLREITKEYSLCPKILGLETRQLAGCMHYQFGWCNGACKNKELPIKYNLRFLTAFYKSKIAKWPFRGPINLEGQIINNWCLQDQDFDYDIYKILRRFLKRARVSSIISI